MNKFQITYHIYPIDGVVDLWGDDEIKIKINKLRKYLTFDKKQLMSKYEVRLYEWILKKQNKAYPIIETIIIDYNTNKQNYYISYCNTNRKSSIISDYEKFNNQQNKYRAKHYGKMGR